jgi:hypothetical protein
MKDKFSPHEFQTLSAYLDRNLSTRDKARLETRLEQDAALRAELEGLKQTRLMLQTLPKRRAPRNFTLSSAMLPRRPARLIFPTFRFASALAGLLLVATFAGQYFLGGTALTSPAPDQSTYSAASNIALTPALAPPIISWGTPTYPPMLGERGGGGGGEPKAGAPGPESSTNGSTNRAAVVTQTPQTGQSSAAAAPAATAPAAIAPTATSSSDSQFLSNQTEPVLTPSSPPAEPASTQAVTPAVAQPAPTVAAALPNPQAPPQITEPYATDNNAGPILGVQPTGDLTAAEPTPNPAPLPHGSSTPPWGWIEGSLGVILAATTLAAYYFYRREKI